MMGGVRFWRGKFEVLQFVEYDPGNDQARVLLVVGGNDVPRPLMCASCFEAVLIRFCVFVPELALADICGAEFPILFRLFNSFEETTALLVFRQMQEKFDDPRAVSMEMRLRFDDGAIASFPKFL